jgi:prevent-host-death family protein
MVLPKRKPKSAPASEAFNMHEAKTHFSRLVERVEAGEEILIARAGRPVARLVPLDARTRARVPGRWRDQVHLAADFDQADTELLDAFEA